LKEQITDRNYDNRLGLMILKRIKRKPRKNSLNGAKKNKEIDPTPFFSYHTQKSNKAL